MNLSSFSYSMDGLSADKLRIFLQPVEAESRPKVKSHENDSAGPEETAVTTLPSVSKPDQVDEDVLFPFHGKSHSLKRIFIPFNV